jgi:hypothetical protein
MMKTINLTALILILLPLTGCGLTPEAHNRRVDMANYLPEEVVCGRVMGLEYFTGTYVPVNSFTKNAAIESMRQRNINCTRYTESLISKNREGNAADSAQRDLRRAISREIAEKNELNDLKREVKKLKDAAEERCSLRGGFMTSVGCTR